jgi:phosphotransferase system enzyme I (PtsI)
MTARLQGIGAAPGVAVGRAVVWREPPLETAARPGAGPEAELARLAAAVETSREQLRDLAAGLATAAGEKEARIFRVHLLFLDDPMLMGAVKTAIEREGLSAEQAVARTTRQLVAQFRALKDGYLRERAADVQDLGQRLLANLAGEQPRSVSGILVARDLTPSEASLLAGQGALAVVTEEGGPTGHMAILARALRLPAVVGAHDALVQVRDGDLLALDGASGEVIVGPDDATVAGFRRRMEEQRVLRARLEALRDLPAVTPDGFRITLAANIATPAEVDLALEAGAEAVGVFRTEYLFVNRAEPPSEDEQYEAYRDVLSRMAPRRVIVRTMDLGGDKQAPVWDGAPEPNPALGLRGIRFALAREPLFRSQLRALIRASGAGNLAVMLPMIADLAEVRRTRRLLGAIQEELGVSVPVSLGVMVETPAAALLATELAAQTDFLSIGTNDLTQYVLAADRLNPAMAGLYDPYHPAVLRLMRAVAEAAGRQGKWAGVCGEMGADPLAAPLFVGMGMAELSMVPAAIPAVKDAIRRVRRSDAEALVEETLAHPSAAEIRDCLARFARDRMSQE